ncbi:RNA 2'-phosphotransferase [Kitasatospora cineracea]|uniref:RNA 2'-phosphotransferase n=1 Tax=Kitasatospora cineracea TaxID=88074 RepID=UPI0037899338
MDEKRTVKTSKMLSRILRHDPGAIGVTLDAAGWVEVDALLAALARPARRAGPGWVRSASAGLPWSTVGPHRPEERMGTTCPRTRTTARSSGSPGPAAA